MAAVGASGPIVVDRTADLKVVEGKVMRAGLALALVPTVRVCKHATRTLVGSMWRRYWSGD